MNTSDSTGGGASPVSPDTVIARFQDLGWGRPRAVWAAPGRVNVIGDHTDYNDGYVLPMAIDRYAVTAAAPRSDGRLRVHSAQRGETAEVELAELDRLRSDQNRARGWSDYPVGVAWALQDAGLPLVGADVVIDSDVPIGAGLSSSAAIECATGLALAGAAAVEIAPAELARLAQRAENVYVGMPCGPLDQLASVHGEAGNVLFIDTRDLAVTRYPFELASSGMTLLVVDSRASHDHGDDGYADRRASCERAAAHLGVPALRDIGVDELAGAMDALDDVTARRVRHVVTENARVRQFVELLRGSGIAVAAADAGEILTASHASMRDDYEISCPELDLIVETALKAGAHGARMTGGGFGGSAIALVDASAVTDVREAVDSAFQRAGFTAPAYFPAVAERGAHQVA